MHAGAAANIGQGTHRVDKLLDDESHTSLPREVPIVADEGHNEGNHVYEQDNDWFDDLIFRNRSALQYHDKHSWEVKRGWSHTRAPTE